MKKRYSLAIMAIIAIAVIGWMAVPGNGQWDRWYGVTNRFLAEQIVQLWTFSAGLTGTTVKADSLDANEITADTLTVPRFRVPLNGKLFFGNTDSTYITTSAENTWDWYNGGVIGLRMTAARAILANRYLQIGNSLTTADSLRYLLLSPGTLYHPAIAFGDTSSGIALIATDDIRIIHDSQQYWKMTKSFFGGGGSQLSVLYQVNPTSSVPNILPNQSDINTGIGHVGGTSTTADSAFLIAGGTTVAGWYYETGAGWTNNTMFDVKGRLKVDGAIYGNSLTRFKDTFAGTAGSDTVVNAAFTADMIAIASWNYVLSDSNSIISAVPGSGQIIFYRVNIDADASALKAGAGYSCMVQF